MSWKTAFEFNNKHSHSDREGAINPRTMRIEERATFEIPSGKKTLKVTITDTKGYGDDMNAKETIRPIKEELTRRLQMHKQNVEQHMTGCSKEDELIHACLYFI